MRAEVMSLSSNGPSGRLFFGRDDIVTNLPLGTLLLFRIHLRSVTKCKGTVFNLQFLQNIPTSSPC